MANTKPLLSIISPTYSCDESLKELYERVIQTTRKITDEFELILVNDNSPDNSWNTIIDLGTNDKRVKGLLFSRNFGQHCAIAAGLNISKGEWVVVLDCDLQDQPEEIYNLYKKAIEGYDIVLGRRKQRKDNLFKRLFSFLFYRVLAYMTETQQDPAIGNFGIYNRKVINAVNEMKDQLKYFPAMVRWVGFKQTSIDLEHAGRKYGKTSYNFNKLLRLGLDVMISFSDKPLRLIVGIGLIISISTFIYGLIMLVMYFLGKIAVIGYTSLILSVWFFSGMLIFLLGFTGLYIGKIFEKVKQRPIYIIKEEINI
jgi:polyisoprenyl-phosphate glycosyltransferase